MRRSQYSARAGSIWLAAFMSASAWGQVQKTPDARQSVDDVTLGLKIGEPGRVQVPVMASWKLANGMRVVVGPNAGQPLISGTLLVRAGMLFDPPDRMGLTEIAARALQHGIGEQGGDQKLQKLTQWGAQLEISAEMAELKIAFICLGRHLKPMLELVAGLVREPGFSVESLEAAKDQLRVAIAQRNRDPSMLAQRLLNEALIAENATRRLSLGHSDVDPIQRDDLIRFQQQYLRPGGAQLSLTGDLEAGPAREMVESSFGRWEAGVGATPARRKPGGQPVKGVLFARTPDSEKATLIAGHKGIQLTDADYLPTLVMAHVLNGRIEQAIERNALWASWNLSFQVMVEAHPLQAGPIQIKGTSSTGSASQAVKFLKNQIPELLLPPVTEAELEEGRRRTRTTFQAIGAQEPMLFQYCAWLRFHEAGASRDLLGQWQTELAGVTKSAVEKAKQHFRPAEFTIVVAGHAESFYPPLEGAQEIDLSNAPPKAPEPVVSEEGRRLGPIWLAKMQSALGGLEKLASMEDFKAEYEGEMRGGGKLSIQERWMRPETFRQDQEIAGRTISVFYNGKIGWAAQAGRVVPLSFSALQQTRGAIFRQLFLMALTRNEGTGTVNYLGAGALELTGEHEQWARVQLNEETLLPEKTSYRIQTESGGFLPAEELYSDWREERGVKWPGRILTRRGGSENTDLRLIKIEWNTGLTQTEIEKKP